MFKRNQDIRAELKKSKVPIWLLAERLEVHENTVYRMLNKELEPTQRERLLSIVKELKQVAI